MNLRTIFMAALLAAGCTTPRSSRSAPLPVRLAKAQPPTSRDTNAIMEVILGAKQAIGGCVQEERQSTAATGKILLVFDILPTGEVGDVGVAKAEAAAWELSRCLAAVVSELRFASSADRETIVFPFKF